MDDDVKCPYCKKFVSWETVREHGESANIPGMLRFLSNLIGEDVSNWNITEAYYYKHGCGRGLVAAELPEACNPDENGFKAPAYLVVSLNGKVEPGERLLPLRVAEASESEIRLVRDSLKRVK